MQEGAILNQLSDILAATDPVIVMLGGLVLGACLTLAIVKWFPRVRSKSDPLSGLFAGDTLDDQLARVADPKARDERKDRAASAIRAKIFAHKSAQRAQRQTPPHRAERFEHAAVLDHIAKVMRASKESDEAVVPCTETDDDWTGSEWEEVLLLPAPPKDESGVAEAA